MFIIKILSGAIFILRMDIGVGGQSRKCQFSLTLCIENVLRQVGGWLKKASKYPYLIQRWPLAHCPLGTFNIPKYFEFQWEDNEEDYKPTALNENRTYIVFCSWWNDLTVFGIIPFVALVVFNLKIYFKVRSSDKLEYRFVGRKANSTRSTLETHVRDFSLRRYILTYMYKLL